MRTYRFLILITLLLVLAVSVLHIKAQIPAWQPDVAYGAGALVTYSGSTYRCIQGHTSQVGWEPPNVAALWALETAPTNTPAGATFTPTKTPTKTNTPGGATFTPTNTPTKT